MWKWVAGGFWVNRHGFSTRRRESAMKGHIEVDWSLIRPIIVWSFFLPGMALTMFVVNHFRSRTRASLQFSSVCSSQSFSQGWLPGRAFSLLTRSFRSNTRASWRIRRLPLPRLGFLEPIAGEDGVLRVLPLVRGEKGGGVGLVGRLCG